MKSSQKIIDSKAISEYIFFPNGRGNFDIKWMHINGIKLSCYHHIRSEDSFNVLVFHGNGESVSDYLGIFSKIFKEAKLNFFLVEFRGYSRSSGVPTLTNIIEDAKAVFDKLKLDKSKTLVYGRSLGAIPALNLAIDYSLAGLIIEHGVFDIKKWLTKKIIRFGIKVDLKKVNREIEETFVTEKDVADYKGKALILHSINDTLVSFKQHAEKLHNTLTCDKRLVPFQIGSHNAYLKYNVNTIYDEVEEFVERLQSSTGDAPS